jgi:hypothetical protein
MPEVCGAVVFGSWDSTGAGGVDVAGSSGGGLNRAVNLPFRGALISAAFVSVDFSLKFAKNWSMAASISGALMSAGFESTSGLSGSSLVAVVCRFSSMAFDFSSAGVPPAFMRSFHFWKSSCVCFWFGSSISVESIHSGSCSAFANRSLSQSSPRRAPRSRRHSFLVVF